MCGLGEKTDLELDYWMRIANDHGERNDSKRVVVEVADLQAQLVDTVAYFVENGETFAYAVKAQAVSLSQVENERWHNFSRGPYEN